MTLICDAGALVALERGDRRMWRRLKAALHDEVAPVTHGGVVAQVWRGGSGRQALLARALAGLHVIALDDALGREAGVLMGRARTADAVDAALVALAADEDVITTSDAVDLVRLVAASGRHIDVVGV